MTTGKTHLDRLLYERLTRDDYDALEQRHYEAFQLYYLPGDPDPVDLELPWAWALEPPPYHFAETLMHLTRFGLGRVLKKLPQRELLLLTLDADMSPLAQEIRSELLIEYLFAGFLLSWPGTMPEFLENTIMYAARGYTDTKILPTTFREHCRTAKGILISRSGRALPNGMERYTDLVAALSRVAEDGHATPYFPVIHYDGKGRRIGVEEAVQLERACLLLRMLLQVDLRRQQGVYATKHPEFTSRLRHREKYRHPRNLANPYPTPLLRSA